MQSLYISPAHFSPEISFSPVERDFYIRGVSSPEDVRALYYPVIEWLKQFCDEVINNKTVTFSQEEPLVFVVDLKYFNSSSAKFLYDILFCMKRLKNTGIPVVIGWYYQDEDTDMLEAGQDFSEALGLEFNLIPKQHRS
jgi:hypothetical protein